MPITLDGTTGEQLSGNLTFTGTGQRITGDMTNSTQSNRVTFQTSTTNGNTSVGAIPNGTATSSNFSAFAGTDPGNASYVRIRTDGTTSYLESGINGTATQLPLQFYTSNTNQMTIATDGTITGTKGNLQLISGTAVASTSGTSIDFTSIPSWVKRITVMLAGVSTNGTSNLQIQLGSGSITTTGYISSATALATLVASTTTTTALLIEGGSSHTATDTLSGSAILSLQSGNTWVMSSTFGRGTAVMVVAGGSIALSGTLDRVRITTANGTDTFDAGSINILYE